MNIIVAKDYEELSRISATFIADEIKANPNIVLGLATGGTPIGTYQELIRMYKEEKLDFSKVTTFNLDEYYGLSADHEQSYAHFMKMNLFDHINISNENTYIPNGTTNNLLEECKNYDELILKKGGIDLQLLGIGLNGHIGFNEPCEELRVGTHLVELDERTIKANSRFFNSLEEVPRQAITMGLGPIMMAKKILLLAYGEEKANIIGKILNGRCSTKIPASILQIHPCVTIIIDETIHNYLIRENIIQR